MRAFLAEGAKAAFSSTSQTKIDNLVATLDAGEDRVAGFVADMTSEEEIKNLVDSAVARFGTLDVVIANAALYLASEVSSHTAGMGMHVDCKVHPSP